MKKFDADWKANPSEVIAKVNKCLAKHGLKFVEHDTHSDTHKFELQELPKKAVDKK